MSTRMHLFLLLVIVASIAGCGGSRNFVVLVPDPDGTVGSITVSNPAGTVEIDKPYLATTIKDKKTAPGAPAIMDKKEIDSIFSEVLKIQPEPPIHFFLYNEKNSTELKSESQKLLPMIFEAIRKRKSVNISVVGHSDTAGNKVHNLKLSTRRAQAVTNMLIQKGVKKENIDTTSHGEENPLFETGDDVSDPRNRRVEVIVR